MYGARIGIDYDGKWKIVDKNFYSKRDVIMSKFPKYVINQVDSEKSSDILIVIFLRGAADGLNMVVPFGEDVYYQLRPSLGVPRPDDKTVEKAKRAIPLDDFFGLHPNLKPLFPIWEAGNLAIIHACGSPDDSHSHFKAMNLMERGIANENGPASGWISRYLVTKETKNTSPLRAIGIGSIPQRSLRGGVPVTSFQSIDEFQFMLDEKYQLWLESLILYYYQGADELNELGLDTFRIYQSLQGLDVDTYLGTSEFDYPDTDLGSGLKQIAMLIKADVGLEVAALDHNNWDTHFAQGLFSGIMPTLLTDLATSLAAFYADIQEYLSHITIVVMSEFGRRAYENGSLGTDHGHGEVMFLIGENVKGGKVYTNWPGLQKERLYGPGDLAVTIDYRDVLAELCLKRLHNPQIDIIFPGFTPAFPDVFD